MQIRAWKSAAICAVAGIVLVGCAEATLSTNGKSGFQGKYMSARMALEKGNYAQANRLYASLLPSAGPLEPRIRLEFAHSQLRAGKFGKAAQTASVLAQSQTGAARSAALSVQGTAEHEAALEMLKKGRSQEAQELMRSAQSAMAEVLTSNPELDPLGAIAGRKATIDVRLKTLR